MTAMKTWRTGPGQKGAWALAYRFRGGPQTGIMLASANSGWLLSGAIRGRGAGIGWANRRFFGGPEFTISFPKDRPKARVE